jgi:hypothetical protein
MIVIFRKNENLTAFQQNLKRLRVEIDTVPLECRPELRRLANQIEQQQHGVIDDLAATCDLADDLDLKIASTAFELWACRHDAERIRHALCPDAT